MIALYARRPLPTLLCLSLFAVALLAGCQPEPDRSPSSSPNVTVLAQPFNIKSLSRSRTIRLYLPPDYATSEQRYPVLYMHDGQNLFDNATAYAGEWRVDETLNQLAADGKLQLIVVGIDNGGEHRMTELSPVDHAQRGKAEAREYLQFIRDELKPYIDKEYRTLADAAHTGLMGSSMGGLVSHFAALEMPQTFGKYGIFSPSYWASGNAVVRFEQSPVPAGQRWYFYMGGEEGGEMVPDIQRVYQALDQLPASQGERQLRIVAEADHNEAAWANEFGRAVLWLFAEQP